MKAITLYHNSDCSKSRAVFEILEKSGQEFEVVEYLKTPLSYDEFDALLNRLNLQPEQIVRSGEDLYEDLEAYEKIPSTRSGWIHLMMEHPILMERPIVSDSETAVVGRPPEKVSQWLRERKN